MIKDFEILPTHYQEWVKDSCVKDELLHNVFSLEGDSIYEYLFAFDDPDRRNNGRLTNKELNRYQHCTEGGWWFQSVDVRTGKPNDYGCFKPDNPREDSQTGKVIKYETPKNSPPLLLAFDVPADVWQPIADRCEVKQGKSANFYQWLFNNPRVPLFITEGAKKTGCLLSVGYAAVGLNGWTHLYQNTEEGREINPELAFLLENRERVYLCFDQDDNKSTRTMIHKGLRRFTHLVDQKFPKVQVLKVTWPASKGKGVDDFVKANGQDSLHKQIAKARTLQPLDDEPKQEVIIDASTGEKFVETEFPPTEQCLRDLYMGAHYRGINGELYKFNGKFYEKCDEAIEKRKIRQWALTHPEMVNNKLQYTSLSTARIDAIWSYVILSYGIDSSKVNPTGLNLDNGVLKLSWEGKRVSWDLVDHSPDEVYTYCSPVEFRHDADMTNCNKLLSCLDNKQQTVFLRSIAASLDLDAVRERGGRLRAILAEGKGSNGKDSLRNAVEFLLGEKMRSLTFTDFQTYDQGRKFPLAQLEGCALSWSSENSKTPRLDNLQSLKAAITGNKISIEHKNQKEKEFSPSSVFVFNINGFPSLTGGLEAIVSRWCVLSFRKTFKKNADPTKNEIEADPRFHYDKEFLIKEVCPALLNRLLAELNNLLEFWIDYDSLEDSLREIQEETNHLWAFCHEIGLEANPNGKIYTSDLWEQLRQWYEDNGTLEIIDKGDGKTKNVWHDQANRWDKNCTAPNQIFNRFSALFPTIKRGKETQDMERKGQSFLSGISIGKLASLPHYPDTVGDSASPSASLCLTSASLFEKEENDQNKSQNGSNDLKSSPSEANGGASEAKVSQAVRQKPLPDKASEAVRQKTQHTISSLAGSVGDRVFWNGEPCILKGKRGAMWHLKKESDLSIIEVHFSECQLVIPDNQISVGDWVHYPDDPHNHYQVTKIENNLIGLCGTDSKGNPLKFLATLGEIVKSEANSNNGTN